MGNDKLKIYVTSKDDPSKRISLSPIEELSKDTANIKSKITIEPKNQRQEILGFGGSFTEASSSIYKELDKEKKEEIIESYFGKNGNKYSMARTHINSCDFSLGNYAHVEDENDLELKTFSLERNKISLIPMINDALKKRKNKIKIMASPWSPPAWMKTTGEMNFGGKLKSEYRDTWADYYCKFIENCEKENVPIWGLSIQNEPEAKQTWDSCLYTAEEERDFIKNHLGPSLEKHNLLDRKVIIWDHNRDVMVERARTVLSDPDAAKYVWGTGFHWYCGDHFDNVQKVHDEFPDKQLIFTEGCQEGGPHIGSWDLGERYATSIINDLNRWTVAWIDWNLILNEQGGPNHVGNYCSAPIIVDTRSQDLLYQSSYYYIGHFSRFILPGDKIINSKNTNDIVDVLSSINDQNIVNTVIQNKNESRVEINYYRGNVNSVFSIPGRSIVTVVDDIG
ncbi:MAG: glucosylceramidase [Candidatus Marinimicrobia bacterium]|nr:glucosylceramidase [Candidatus Neomarinimicrobiota bacterium]